MDLLWDLQELDMTDYTSLSPLMQLVLRTNLLVVWLLTGFMGALISLYRMNQVEKSIL